MDINYLCKQYHFKSWLGTLPGWDWTWNHKDVIPPCEVQMNIGNIRYNLNVKDPKVIKDIVKANR